MTLIDDANEYERFVDLYWQWHDCKLRDAKELLRYRLINEHDFDPLDNNARERPEER